MEPFTFASSGELEIPVSVRIGSLDGYQTPIPFSKLVYRPDLRYIGSNMSPHSDLYVTVQLWADSKPLTVPVQTAYKAFKTERIWNEWLTLPIDYATLPLSAQLAITIWDLSPTGGESARGHAIPFGGTTVPLFDSDNTLQKGRQKCRVYRHKAADGLSETTTPSIRRPRYQLKIDKRKVEENGDDEYETDRLEKLFKKHEMGEIQRVDWLDQLVFRQLEKRGLNAQPPPKKPVKKHSDRNRIADGHEYSEDEGSDNDEDDQFVLYIDLPRFDFPIVFTDHEYPPPPISSHPHHVPTAVSHKPPPEVQLGPGVKGIHGSDDENNPFGGRLIKIYDPEVGARDNPAESMHRRLVRSHRAGVLDRDLKPNAKIRDELNVIMSYGPTQELNAEEKDLVWKFRHHLTRDKRALTKFVKSVSWHDQSEARQAVQILPKWTEIDVDDALELLGPTFDSPAVRAYAVERLRKADDEELLLYLLQLVQALKFEKLPTENPDEAAEDSSLAGFLISRATQNIVLGSYLHWYLMVECDDRSPDQAQEYRKLFARVEFNFMTELLKTPHGPEQRKTLLRQGELITILSKISKEIRFSREDRPHKIERLKRFLADPKNELNSFDPPLPLPLDPSVSIVGIFPDDCLVFKSSLFPLLIPFRTADGRKYPIIFKTGDDLRQDQLVIQIITLMDRLLRKENLDLKLSPYRILATSANAGAVQFVGSMSLAAAVTKYKGSILAYLKANNPDESEPLGVRKEAMETYVKSCAGYCVITYLLGVGDRHLDNLLLAPDGHFFHADFGFILGRDPKPFPPAMKLCKEMVEGMGGANSAHYAAFKQYCFTAYTTLRKSSNLILNLFSLMIDANIPDIKMEPDKAVIKVRDRFHLEMSEEEAIKHFEALIGDSVNAIFPVVIDRLHGLVQHWRA
ncbi:phosphoinositide 3-kinase [Xylona heveae TC161]|uniref:Phosphatidylinositol 3-kinase VPS34 n=1 Tax=Xylona heveae (strain CBS 132557 / TC161) TaxID=1328760 RepID=A0A165H541_XYLHT|nr:phosphoinositide 3-kinase [Xylona heveae TC161]KZF22995.1 phosphoinositide 3-kinase [Xylona heveae TC161]